MSEKSKKIVIFLSNYNCTRDKKNGLRVTPTFDMIGPHVQFQIMRINCEKNVANNHNQTMCHATVLVE